MSLLEVVDLSAAYGPIQVLHGISLTVDAGEVVVVLGANGAGKTTALRAISGLVAAKGELRFDGVSILGRHPESIAHRGVSHVPQGRGTLAGLTVDENMRLGAYSRRDREGIAADLAEWYDTFPPLAKRRSQTAGTMSGGEQQMLAVARSLMSRPRLLLLDEPSLGLAPLVTKQLFETLATVNRERGIAMLLVEQNAALALELAARGYVLEAGEIVASGTAENLSRDGEIRKAYLGR
ncbi:MAG: ABC transporter ATP-binding protein [Acidimicrobiia bacterium]|nr:ABC transporter ATP-binding protein [Acidimicrobiia bacterium]